MSEKMSKELTIPFISTQLILGDLEGSYICHARIDKIKRGYYSSGANRGEDYYKLMGKINCRCVNDDNTYFSNVIFVSEKVYNLVQTLMQFTAGYVQISFDVDVIKCDNTVKLTYNIIYVNFEKAENHDKKA